MALIDLKNITMGFGSPPLFQGVNLRVEKGERVCLVGRNGAGKSTLLKVINGDLPPDGGELAREPGLNVQMLSQEIPMDLGGTVFDVVTGGLGRLHGLVSEYHAALSSLEEGEGSARAIERIHHELEARGGWSAGQRTETIISRLKLPADTQFKDLSGGYKRRVLLGRALVSDPDLLLLDEPTNHLDMDAIEWLEEFLLGYRGALLFVTHDRMLIKRLARRIIELDKGTLLSWQCGYETYVERKEALVENEARSDALFDKKLSEEEAWVRQGIKARRTRNEGRVRALIEMRRLRAERREAEGSAKMRLLEAELSGRLVIEAKDASYGFGAGADIIKSLSAKVMRGDKVGIIGPNGSGKTTLLKLLLGQLVPSSGSVRLGSRIEVAYFDQHRLILDENRSVQENVAGGNDQIIIEGRPRHVIGYLQDFLFSPARSRTPVRALSGGEKNRLLLAKLFARPSNVIVMDEPTNDLDADTLDLLEDLLVEYQGTVLVVSHDRAFLNNVATSTLVFEDGGINEYIGGYDDWLRSRPSAPAKEAKKPAQERRKNDKPVKLSFNQERELNELPARIEALEARQKQIYSALASPDIYKDGGQKVAGLKALMREVEAGLESAYLKWEELEAIKGAQTEGFK